MGNLIHQVLRLVGIAQKAHIDFTQKLGFGKEDRDILLQARDMIQCYQDDDLGDIAVPGFVPVLSETKSEIAWLGSSEVGAHNEEIYCGLLGMTQTELQELKNDGII